MTITKGTYLGNQLSYKSFFVYDNDEPNTDPNPTDFTNLIIKEYDTPQVNKIILTFRMILAGRCEIYYIADLLPLRVLADNDVHVSILSKLKVKV